MLWAVCCLVSAGTYSLPSGVEPAAAAHGLKYVPSAFEEHWYAGIREWQKGDWGAGCREMQKGEEKILRWMNEVALGSKTRHFNFSKDIFSYWIGKGSPGPLGPIEPLAAHLRDPRGACQHLRRMLWWRPGMPTNFDQVPMQIPTPAPNTEGEIVTSPA
eukprot:Hpha_TRINITY_DN34872_c0_g1::TRINITY_DN34872_c0_g1_i1::g.167900::m.167900